MQQYNNIEKLYNECIATETIKSKLEEIIKAVKEVYSEFYKNNISSIDKIKSVDFEKYILNQVKKPLGTCTVKLEKNSYVLQIEQQETKDFIYLLFDKKITPVLPVKDVEQMNDLLEKYPKYVLPSKTEILTNIYDDNIDTFKKNKITKTNFLKTPISELIKTLNDININTNKLEKILDYYEVKTINRTSLKRGKSDIKLSSFYFDFENLNNSLDSLTNDKKIFMATQLLIQVEKNIDYLKKELLKYDEENIFISESYYETLESLSLPISQELREIFCKKIIDKSAINKAIKEGKLDLEQKTSFTFFEAVGTLADLVKVYNEINYAKQMSLNTKTEIYNSNDVINLN